MKKKPHVRSVKTRPRIKPTMAKMISLKLGAGAAAESQEKS